MFEKLKFKLKDEYKPYTDKGKKAAKQRNLHDCVKAVMKDLRQTARTREQSVQTAKLLYQLADCAVRCETEQEMSAPVISQEEAQEEISEAISFGFGGLNESESDNRNYSHACGIRSYDDFSLLFQQLFPQWNKE